MLDKSKFSWSHILNLVLYNLIYSSYLKFWSVEISVKSKKFWKPVLKLVLFNLILMCQNFGFHEVTFQSLIYKSIQILFAMSKLSIKSITKSVNNMAIRSIVFIDKLAFFYNKVTKYEKMVEITEYIKNIIYSGTCLIQHTKGPGKCVGLCRMSEYSNFTFSYQ
jgi:hypothetical protein